MRALRVAVFLFLFFVSPSFGIVPEAQATFTPGHVDNVLPGDPVLFDITVAVGSLSGFNIADIVIGSDDVTDISFAYSSAWNTAFANPTTPLYDVGFYTQDVYVGGNNPTSVGTSLLLGTITVDTTGLLEDTYWVKIDNGFDGTSVLGLDAATEALNGSGSFTVIPEPMSVLLFLGAGVIGCIRRQRRR